ncbi:MAG TPA: MFS transporter [Acetobacteraceae bacterium]|nr:MFS transporter [Acetobacteraceae bacterium]
MSSRPSEPDSVYAWGRLCAIILLSTIGGVGMWSVVVVLPAVQATFGTARAGATVPFTLTMLGFAFGGVALGRVADRFGITISVIGGALLLSAGYVAGGFAGSLWQFALAQGVLIGAGCSATFAPIIADVSLWFVRRRGIAVALAACGNYLAGVLWPPLVQHFIGVVGWRVTYLGIGVVCAAAMIPLAFILLRRPPAQPLATAQTMSGALSGSPGLSPNALMMLLSLAGVGCCVAMSMPQVHIVAYCGDLGYGPARGAEMLSLMLGFGIISRIASGFIADRIGGLRTLLLGSVLQMVALLLYLGFDGLTSLYVISALFGLFQGGLVPSYAIIVREYFPAREAGTRFGVIVMATLFGMALGGWMSGAIFDLAGSYRAAFANGVLWNALNLSIALLLLARRPRYLPAG